MVAKFKIVQPKEGKTCSNFYCPRKERFIFANELTAIREYKTKTYFYHWMCCKDFFLILKDNYKNDAFNIPDIDLFARLRVRRAFKDNEIKETEVNEPAFKRETSKLLKHLRKADKSYRQILKKIRRRPQNDENINKLINEFM